MLTTNFTVNGKEYKARLNAKACIMAERKLGKNPLNIFIECTSGNIPKLEDLLVILQASLAEYNHGISMDDMYGIYDEMVDEGKGMIELATIVMNIFEESGFLSKETTVDTEKN